MAGRTQGRRGRARSALLASTLAVGSVLVCGAVVAPTAGAASRPAAGPVTSHVIADSLAPAAASPVTRGFASDDRRAPEALRPGFSGPSCTFNGQAGPILDGVTPGATIAIACSGWLPGDTVTAFQISPLFLSSPGTDDVDLGSAVNLTADGSGNLRGGFVVPNPFTAVDPAAVCPPTPAQVSAGYHRCGLLLADSGGGGSGNVGLAAVAFNYAASAPSSASVVGMASTADGGGYWLAWSNGLVTVHGDALAYGDASTIALNSPIAHIVATSDGAGYWLVAGDGGTFAFGDAQFFGSMGGTTLNRPVVDLAPTPDDGGYWLVASDGGIFAFGDAGFHGSTGGLALNRPVVGLAADATTGGYWEVASDGGIFAFGAPFHGSTGNIALNRPINGMTATQDSGGYLFVASDGGIFAFGDAAFHGSAGGIPLNAPIVGMALDPTTGGYWLVASDGGIFAYGAPFYGAG